MTVLKLFDHIWPNNTLTQSVNWNKFGKENTSGWNQMKCIANV